MNNPNGVRSIKIETELLDDDEALPVELRDGRDIVRPRTLTDDTEDLSADVHLHELVEELQFGRDMSM